MATDVRPEDRSSAILTYETPQRPARWLKDLRIVAYIVTGYCILATCAIWFEVLQHAFDPQFGVTVTFGSPSPLKSYHVDVSPITPLCAMVAAVHWFIAWRASRRSVERILWMISLCLGGLMVLPCLIW